MSEESSGLPMAPKWDEQKLQEEIAGLKELESKPFVPKAAGYIKRTGPGLLQSAMTLGAGSATASVLAGASFGYKLLWVQPVAMFLGVMMLAALGNVVLTTRERPYKAFGREMSKIIVFLWALGTIMSSIIWHFPQYGLAAGAARDLAAMAGIDNVPDEVEAANEQVKVAKDQGNNEAILAAEANLKEIKKETSLFSTGLTQQGLMVSFALGFFILGVNIFTTFNYGSGSTGIRLYEWFLRTCIALVVLMFAVVCIAGFSHIQWGEVGKGFIGWYGIPNVNDPVQGPRNIQLVLGMLGAAVGINMTFLYPYSLLAKGWRGEHKTLARWDLGMSMFLPFVLVTSLVIIGMTVSGVYDGNDILREGLKPLEASRSLSDVLGEKLGRVIFDLGLIGMTAGAISTHMVVCGFTWSEMLGLKQSKTLFRIFALTPAIGILGVVANLPFWFPVAASAVCFAMLPIAYLTFLIMNNKRSYIGDAVGKGFSRMLFNFFLVVALCVATIGSIIQINSRVIQNPKVREYVQQFFGFEKVEKEPVTPQPQDPDREVGEVPPVDDPEGEPSESE